ncbi:hypothetical protein [Rivibacter subsaxonicus]|uniref:Uncharacterized protein n=1 Tax=Rivibacter subsaxonicus TaxID=457575 RepID=A0A4Q7VZM3_9BURK|nr:hypothetical protein [Rivibacter subsaxonicus]RZU02163.1 hypothetical protein EV670_0183 [Rivibacter subsaxonicus]
MYLRFKKTHIALVRLNDPSRSADTPREQTVGVVALDATSVPAELAPKLRDAELHQINSLLSAHQQAQRARAAKPTGISSLRSFSIDFAAALNACADDLDETSLTALRLVRDLATERLAQHRP